MWYNKVEKYKEDFMKEKYKNKEKSFRKSVVFYVLQMIVAAIFIYQSLEKNIGGLKKEFSPLLFAYGLICLVMDIIFLYKEWKTYKES